MPDMSYFATFENALRAPRDSYAGHRIVTPGAPGTRVVVCPDCGQLEIWTDEECRDHGQCRSAGGACPVCS